jgi:hypothetical protein
MLRSPPLGVIAESMGAWLVARATVSAVPSLASYTKQFSDVVLRPLRLAMCPFGARVRSRGSPTLLSLETPCDTGGRALRVRSRGSAILREVEPRNPLPVQLGGQGSQSLQAMGRFDIGMGTVQFKGTAYHVGSRAKLSCGVPKFRRPLESKPGCNSDPVVRNERSH